MIDVAMIERGKLEMLLLLPVNETYVQKCESVYLPPAAISAEELLFLTSAHPAHQN